MPLKDPVKRKEWQRKYTKKNRVENRRRARLWYKNNADRSKKRSVKWRQDWTKINRIENPALVIFHRVKNSAKTRKLKFNLTVEDIVLPKKCPILGIKLKINIGTTRGDSYSVDRIDNKKGYIRGNIKVISQRANRMKSSMSKKDIERLWKYVSNP